MAQIKPQTRQQRERYAARVRKLEAEGMTTSDAQACVDAAQQKFEEAKRVADLFRTEWEACGCTLYTVRGANWVVPICTTFTNAGEPEAMPSDAQIEVARRLAVFPDLLRAARKAAKAFARFDGECSDEGEAVGELQAEIRRAEGRRA